MNNRKPPTELEVRDIVFTPNDAVRLAMKTIEERRATKNVGVRIGIPPVDDYLLPCRPGELITILGMTSNYKSGLMQYWARYVANDIVKQGIEDECVVYVTWEQAIEEMLTFDLSAVAKLSATDVFQGRISDEQMAVLQTIHGVHRAVTPIFLIGHSLQEEKRRPRLTLTAVGMGLNFIKREFGYKPRIIFLDYLQQIEPEEGEDRRLQTFYNVHRCKDMTLAMACPVVMGIQVGRDVYRESWGVPGIATGLESSNIEHTSDKSLGTWMPKTTHELGKRLDVKGVSMEVTENLLVLKVLKQKMGPAGKWWPLHVNPAINEIAPMDVHHRELNGEE